MSILITGGDGFIGRCTAALLHEAGFEVVVLDSLVNGQKERGRYGRFVLGGIADTSIVRDTLRQHRVSTVIHLAASAQVGESLLNPAAHFTNNVAGSLDLLHAMIAENVLQLVFASTCAVYGSPASLLTEDTAPHPINPYGQSKLFIEQTLPWLERAHGLQWIALRYFNVAGASVSSGEDIARSRRIIPRAIDASLHGSTLEILGGAHGTPDGSAVRDYVHVRDVARANHLAIQFLRHKQSGAVINICSGVGVSVCDIVREVKQQTSRHLASVWRPAREGEAASAIGTRSLAREVLGWEPAESTLTDIVSSVIRFSGNIASQNMPPLSRANLRAQA